MTEFLKSPECLSILAVVSVGAGTECRAYGRGRSCKSYLTASKDAQDDAVKKIAVAQNDSSVLTRKADPRSTTSVALTMGSRLGALFIMPGANRW